MNLESAAVPFGYFSHLYGLIRSTRLGYSCDRSCVVNVRPRPSYWRECSVLSQPNITVQTQRLDPSRSCTIQPMSHAAVTWYVASYQWRTKTIEKHIVRCTRRFSKRCEMSLLAWRCYTLSSLSLTSYEAAGCVERVMHQLLSRSVHVIDQDAGDYVNNRSRPDFDWSSQIWSPCCCRDADPAICYDYHQHCHWLAFCTVVVTGCPVTWYCHWG